MIVISHRGNLDGPNPEMENKPVYIKKALDKSIMVECDIWCKNGELWLGHDEPQYKIDLEFLKHNLLICHAKNCQALDVLINNNIHCFSHNMDDVVLTSKNWLWTYPGKPVIKNSIAVMPEMVDNWDITLCKGVCTDYCLKYL